MIILEDKFGESNMKTKHLKLFELYHKITFMYVAQKYHFQM